MNHETGRDDGLTSEELDSLLESAETVEVPRSNGPTEVRLSVAVDAGTLGELEQRAAARGTDLNEVATEALRTGTHRLARGS